MRFRNKSMPIYEYQAVNREKACPNCRQAFEVLQGTHEAVLSACPDCGNRVKKVISWCRAAVTEPSEDHSRTMAEIKDYESAGMWSHAAELADKHSEKTKDRELKTRALDDYAKAGYDPATLSRHANISDD